MPLSEEFQLQVISDPKNEPEALIRGLALFTVEHIRDETTPLAVPPSTEDVLEQVENLHYSTTAVIFALGRSIVASAGYTRTYSQGEGFLVDVATCPNHRGRGLGRNAVSAAETAAAKSGISTMRVMPLNESIGFYLKIGYEPYKSGYIKQLR